MKVTDLKQINFWLTEDGKLKSSMKTHVGMLNPGIEVIWIKFKNTLASNNDACICINKKSNKIGVVKKYHDAVMKNKDLRQLIGFYVEAGYTLTGK